MAKVRQVAGFAWVNGLAHAFLADTRVTRPIVGREMAETIKARPTDRTGMAIVLGRLVRGRFATIKAGPTQERCTIRLMALIPDASEGWVKGLLLPVRSLAKIGLRTIDDVA